MKHIKKFEGLRFDFYSQITFEEFCKFRNPYNLKSFTIEEKNHIEKLLNKSSNIIHHRSSEIFIKTRYHSKLRAFNLLINKLEDEWFAIEKKWFNIDKYIITCYKCDQMDGLLKFLEDEEIITRLDIKEGYSMPPDEIQDYFLELTDRDKNEVTIEDKTQEELASLWEKRPHYLGPVPIYLNSKKIYATYLPITKARLAAANHNMSTTAPFNPSKDEVTYMMFTINQPRDRIRGNLDVKGYTLDTIKYYLDKFVRYSKVPVNIYAKDLMTNTYNDPLSTSVVRIEFLN